MARRLEYDEFGYPRFRMGPEPDHDLTRSKPPRDKSRYSYSYDPFTIWGPPFPNKECNGSDYTDRLEQWDYDKYNRLAKEIYKDARPFDSYHCRGDLIEKFLRAYHGNETIKLLRVIEYCNWSSGYPTWRLDYTK